MQPIVFDKAGHFMLNEYVGGRPVKSPATSLFRHGVVQSITPNISINGSPISDGNSLWAAMNLDTSIEGNIAVQLGFMPPELYAFIMGDKIEEVENIPFPVIDEGLLVPDNAPYEVELEKTPTKDTLILVDVHGKALKPVQSGGGGGGTGDDTPKTGEYKLTDKKLTFSEEDAGKTLYAAYDFEATKVTKFGLPKTPRRKSYQLIISGAAIGEDETLYHTALILDKSKVLGAINPPAQGGEPQSVTITFEVQAPRGNNRAVDYMTTPME